MCDFDYEAPSFTHKTWQKARKEHRCCECSRTITPGEGYYKTTGCWDGTISRFKVCAHCDRATALLRQECHGWVFEHVREDLQEHANRHYPWGMLAARYIVGMRRKWARFDGNGLMKVIECAWRAKAAA